MRTKLLHLFLFLLGISLQPQTAQAVNSHADQKIVQPIAPKKKKGFIKRFIDKKITKYKTKNLNYTEPERRAKQALICGILGLFIPYLVLSIIAVIKGQRAMKELGEYGRDDPYYRKAKIGAILGWIVIGLFGLTLIASWYVFVFAVL